MNNLLNYNGVVLYIDELQHFNKKQQQALLEFIEDGRITLIASTTENAWFNFVKKNYKYLFPDICDRTRFDKTKRNLYKVILEIQEYFSDLPIFKGDDIRIIDSMPIPVCKFAQKTI